ncbi:MULTISPECIES: hypothetical protein [Virgibacillus]|uniref:hypothetical protein n=1 Tax=Virgibacillus TaxID=84406 RepID=UPI0003887AB7|nr:MULTISPECIES: hypothetical protein [Virgibacillus]EQB38495.1 hypothetical protein M948_07885 [Virgibacillus sp. CM-4]
MPFQPTIDGYTLLEEPVDAFRNGMGLLHIFQLSLVQIMMKELSSLHLNHQSPLKKR